MLQFVVAAGQLLPQPLLSVTLDDTWLVPSRSVPEVAQDSTANHQTYGLLANKISKAWALESLLSANKAFPFIDGTYNLVGSVDFNGPQLLHGSATSTSSKRSVQSITFQLEICGDQKMKSVVSK